MDNYNPQNPAYPAGMPPMNPQGYPQAQPAEMTYTNPGAPAYAAAPDPMNAYHQPMAPAQSAPAAMSPEAMAFLSGSDMSSSKKSGKKGGGGFFGGFIGGLLAVIIVGGVLFFNGAITVDDLMGTSTSDSTQLTAMDESVKKMEVDATTMTTAIEDLTKKMEEMTKTSETQTESFTKMEEAIKTLTDDVDALKKGTKPATTPTPTPTNPGGLSPTDIRNLLNPPKP